jgi:hypothetical protein
MLEAPMDIHNKYQDISNLGKGAVAKFHFCNGG